MAYGASQELSGEDLVKHEKFLKAKEDLPEPNSACSENSDVQGGFVAALNQAKCSCQGR